MPPDPLQNALAAGRRDPAASQTPTREALAVGTLGRLGEEMLNVLVESSAYARVLVGTREPMTSWVGKVVPQRVDGEDPLPRVDDCYCVLGGEVSYMKRDRAYMPATADDVVPLARRVQAAGARRFVLVAPLEAFMQLSSVAAGISGEMETTLAGLGFESLVVVRPTSADRGAAGSLGQRVAAMLGRTVLHYVLPPAVQPLRARKVAEATLRAALAAAAGTRVISARELSEAAGGPEDPRRRF